jgi:hypothetical protein
LTPPVEVVSTAASQVPFAIAGASGQTGNLQEWRATTGGTVLTKITSTGTVNTPKLDVNPTNTAAVAFYMKLPAGQTSDAIQVRNSANTIIFSLQADGDIYSNPTIDTILSRLATLETNYSALAVRPYIYTSASAPAAPNVGDGWIDPS